jgi:hypothetical protein
LDDVQSRIPRRHLRLARQAGARPAPQNERPTDRRRSPPPPQTLRQHGLPQAATIIERRTRTRQLRIGFRCADSLELSELRDRHRQHAPVALARPLGGRAIVPTQEPAIDCNRRFDIPVRETGAPNTGASGKYLRPCPHAVDRRCWALVTCHRPYGLFPQNKHRQLQRFQ